MKKRLISLFAAICMLLFAATIFAKTSTVDAKFILDKTKVSAADSSRTVNLTVLGVDSSDKVDLYAEQYGSELYAVVSSSLGTLSGGATSAPTCTGSATPGSFATSVKYYAVTQGVAKINVSYGSTVSGTDTLSIQLMEKSPTSSGGCDYNLIASTTKTVTVEAQTASVTSLSYSTSSATTSVAGVSGNTIIYTAGGVSTGGCPTDTVTLDFLKSSDLSTYKTLSTTISDNGSDCIATFVIDNTFTTSGTYYLEAKDGSISSIGCATLTKATVPTYVITAKSTPASLSLSGPYGITTFADNGSSGYNTLTFTVYLKDAEGNYYTPGSSDNYTIKIYNQADTLLKTIYSNGASSATASLDAYTDIKSKSTTSIYATVPSSDITNSDTVTVSTKSYKLVDNTSSAADGSFDTSAMKLSGTIAIDNNSNGTYDSGDDTNVGSISVSLYDGTKLLETVNTTTNSSGSFVAFFTKVVSGSTCTYVFKDANGSYGPLVKANSTNCPTKNYANIKSVKIVDLLDRESSCTTKSTYYSNDKVSKYVFYPYWLAFYDSNGNKLSDNYSEIYGVTGFQVKATTTVTATVAPSGFDNLSGQSSYDNITITYDPTKYSSDNITLSFYDNQSNLSSLTKEITIKGKNDLAKLQINIEQTTLPLNSTVGFSVEAFDSNGNPYTASNIIMKITDNDSVDPTIKESDTTQRYNNYVFSSLKRKYFSLSATNSGTFTLTFESSDGSVSASKTITISPAYTAPTCSTSNLSACTTEADCTALGSGYTWDSTTSTCSEVSSTCSSSNLSACDNESACTDAGGTWDSGTSTCSEASSQIYANPSTPATPTKYDSTNPTLPTPGSVEVDAASSVLIQPTLNVPSEIQGKAAKAKLYIYLPTSYTWIPFSDVDVASLGSSYTFTNISSALDFSGASGMSFQVWYGLLVDSTMYFDYYTVTVK